MFAWSHVSLCCANCQTELCETLHIIYNRLCGVFSRTCGQRQHRQIGTCLLIFCSFKCKLLVKKSRMKFRLILFFFFYYRCNFSFGQIYSWFCSKICKFFFLTWRFPPVLLHNLKYTSTPLVRTYWWKLHFIKSIWDRFGMIIPAISFESAT